MKQDLLDHINFLARNIPAGSVDSTGLEDEVIDLYCQFLKDYSEHEILLEQACFIATKRRIQNYVRKQANLPHLPLQSAPGQDVAHIHVQPLQSAHRLLY